jgi:hypothetical protein
MYKLVDIYQSWDDYPESWLNKFVRSGLTTMIIFIFSMKQNVSVAIEKI